MDIIEALLLSIIRTIVAYPEDVQTHIETNTDDKGEIITIYVKVNNSDVGLCIGEGGKNAEAIRKVIGLAGFRVLNKRIYTKIDTPKFPKNHFTYE